MFLKLLKSFFGKTEQIKEDKTLSNIEVGNFVISEFDNSQHEIKSINNLNVNGEMNLLMLTHDQYLILYKPKEEYYYAFSLVEDVQKFVDTSSNDFIQLLEIEEDEIDNSGNIISKERSFDVNFETNYDHSGKYYLYFDKLDVQIKDFGKSRLMLSRTTNKKLAVLSIAVFQGETSIYVGRRLPVSMLSIF